MRIVTGDKRIITLKELFKGKEKARREMVKLPFVEKIKSLVSLQQIARGWGEKKDIMI